MPGPPPKCLNWVRNTEPPYCGDWKCHRHGFGPRRRARGDAVRRLADAAERLGPGQFYHCTVQINARMAPKGFAPLRSALHRELDRIGPTAVKSGRRRREGTPVLIVPHFGDQVPGLPPVVHLHVTAFIPDHWIDRADKSDAALEAFRLATADALDDARRLPALRHARIDNGGPGGGGRPAGRMPRQLGLLPVPGRRRTPPRPDPRRTPATRVLLPLALPAAPPPRRAARTLPS